MTVFICRLPASMPLKNGQTLSGGQLSYETWGTPRRDGANTILIMTGMSAGPHVSSSATDPSGGWWERMVGPGKPIDTDMWHVVCPNTLGSCFGSSGPSSVNAATGKLYRLSFPNITVEDIADATAYLIGDMGYTSIACVVGCSMGGMTSLALLSRYPGIAAHHINISGAFHALPFSIAIRSLQREAISLDPNWNGGVYDAERYPSHGMSIARKLGIISYRSALEWNGRFGRLRLVPRVDGLGSPVPEFRPEFKVEAYLEHHAESFIHRFDPNSYLFLSRCMDRFDLAEEAEGGAYAVLNRFTLQSALVIGVESDILFPISQQSEIANGLRAAGIDVRFEALGSPQGHDAFLVDHGRFAPIISDYMTKLVRAQNLGHRADSPTVPLHPLLAVGR